jgi:hypothetical protein
VKRWKLKRRKFYSPQVNGFTKDAVLLPLPLGERVGVRGEAIQFQQNALQYEFSLSQHLIIPKA